MTHADGRTRIHIWIHSTVGTARWSIGPLGNRSRTHHQSIGQAVDEALIEARAGREGAVIIVEPVQCNSSS